MTRFGLLLLLLLVPLSAHAVTRNAASCAMADVQAAINLAVHGDIVQLPECSVTNWTSANKNSPSVQVTTQRITLQGVGSGPTGPVTRLKLAAGQSATSGAVMVRVNTVQGSGATPGFTMKDLILEGGNTGTEQHYDQGLYLDDCHNFKIRNNLFTHLGVGIAVFGNPTQQRGVIYDNRFVQISRFGSPQTHGYGVEVNGDNIANPLVLGTEQTVFVEDNSFERIRHSIASNASSRYVFRYNTVKNGTTGSLGNGHAIDAHGLEGWATGSRSYEIYNNHVSNTIATNQSGVTIRGGDGVIYNNTLLNSTHAVTIKNGGSGSNNIGCSGGYPSPYQIRDAYIWNNTPAAIENDCTSLLQLNRDYRTFARPGYTAFTYPHPLRTGDTPGLLPSPPLVFHVTPLP